MTIILSSSSSIDVWQNTLLRYTSCWPFRLPQTMVSVRPPSKTTFVRLRKQRVQAKHILGGLEINWGLIEQHLWMDGSPMLSREDLENQFLLRSGSTTSATYKGRDRARWEPWTQRRDSLWWDRTDHICYNCEQRILFPERIPKWEMQKLPICDLWCLECATQRCCTRGPHQHHLCMECERRGVVFLAPAGGEDPWAANDD